MLGAHADMKPGVKVELSEKYSKGLQAFRESKGMVLGAHSIYAYMRHKSLASADMLPAMSHGSLQDG